jgi:pimeloyl-ACP methyl ester carboxylesterase
LVAALGRRPLVWGEKHLLGQVVEGDCLAMSIGADFTVLRDVGHCLPEENPEAVDAALHR